MNVNSWTLKNFTMIWGAWLKSVAVYRSKWLVNSVYQILYIVSTYFERCSLGFCEELIPCFGCANRVENLRDWRYRLCVASILYCGIKGASYAKYSRILSFLTTKQMSKLVTFWPNSAFLMGNLESSLTKPHLGMETVFGLCMAVSDTLWEGDSFLMRFS